MFRLDEKLARIHAGHYKRRDFLIADAKDPDMGPGLHAVGPVREPDGSTPRLRTRAEFLDSIVAVVEQDIVDVMLASVSNIEALEARGAFAGSAVKPAIRANDTTDIWRHRGARHHQSPSRPFRTASLSRVRQLTDLGLYSITFNNVLDADVESLHAFAEFRADAAANALHYFLEVFNPNVAEISAEDMPRFVNDSIVRCLAGLTKAERPLFLKIAYNGPRALDELASYDPGLVVGVLGGGAGTTRDCFELIHQAEKYGARVALFGRKINLAESPLDVIRFMRAVADGDVTPHEAVKAYHAALAEKGIKPARALAADNEDYGSRPETKLRSAAMEGRRGVLTAGTWCVDFNKSIPAWPAEDTMSTIIAFERQGGGSGFNMAVDLKRLDPDLPVDTMGLVGDDDDGRFLIAQCDAWGIERAGLRMSGEGATPFSDCYNSRQSGRRTHFYGPGIAAKLSPDHFDFSQTRARYLHLGLPGAHATMDAPWRDEATGWAATLRKARAAGLRTNLEMVSTDREKVRAFGRSCLPHLDLLIVNDYEIGCVADIETRDGQTTLAGAVAEGLRAALDLGPLSLAVAHFPEGAIAVTADGAVVALGSVAMPGKAVAGVNGAGDAFAAGMLLGLHEGRALEDCLRLGHACAAASMREVSTTMGVVRAAECLELAERYGHRPRPL